MTNPLNRFAAALFAGLTIWLSFGAQADDASAWSKDIQSEMRLIAGSTKEQTLRAGIEIKLQPGWKTYWRYPGDSGVPPRFDFSGSDNLKSANVLWPAPHQFTDQSGNSIGYKEQVIFPLHITPKEAGKPVKLKLKLDYAVCEKLCVPATGSAEMVLSGTAGALDSAIAAFEARVPKPVSATQAGLTAKREKDGGKPAVSVDFAAPNGPPSDVFVEGPTAEWALPLPKAVSGAAAGRARYRFEFDGLPPGADPKAPADLTFTIVSAGKAIEVKTHLD